ncbi:zinc knuckle CX2CX4HX4C containing protein, partial [Tanacetum coccineum]
VMQEIEEVKKVKKELVPHDLPIVNHYVAPYVPSIPFLRHLKQHVEEALVSQTLESLRELKISRPLIKEIKKTTEYANLTLRNALADLGASVSIKPFSMFKRLVLGKLKPVNMIVEMADRTTQVSKGIIENLLIKIDNFIFPVNFVILDMVEDFRMSLVLGRPLLATTHMEIDVFRKHISLEVGNEKLLFEMEDNINETTIPIESVCVVKDVKNNNEDESFNILNIDDDLFSYDSLSCIKINEFNYLLSIDEDIFMCEIDV